MTEPIPGWYYEHRVGRRRFTNRAHLFGRLRTANDAFGSRLVIAAEPSACGRIKTRSILDFAGAGRPGDPCAPCLARAF